MTAQQLLRELIGEKDYRDSENLALEVLRDIGEIAITITHNEETYIRKFVKVHNQIISENPLHINDVQYMQLLDFMTLSNFIQRKR